jgi:hypothetical protein
MARAQLSAFSERISEVALATSALGFDTNGRFPVKVSITTPDYKGEIGPSGGDKNAPDVAYFWAQVAIAVASAAAGAIANEIFEEDCSTTVSIETTEDAQGNVTSSKTTVTSTCQD